MKSLLRLLTTSFILTAVAAIHAADKPAAPAAPAPAAAVNVAGTWNMEVQTNQGTGKPVFIFTQEGEKLTGTYKGQLGEATVTGSLIGDAITFTFKISPQGQELAITYTGTVTGDTMKGTAKFGTFGEGGFAGKKQAPAAK